ncbi:twin arginine-targeting protein translocase TatB [Vibrio sp. 10N.286.49.B3]|uniref:Sec-independent protein translocase protein TatB n=1 Tax=Vibrio sp. 10N.286.49.B3 TaxID=1880855 RepID=UPI000C81CBD2|nr:Sec-independent protein translocase protein TatB [Vibrio sp. 10N.286.49.B3]PMH46156.1 twin arginine-targeting protein translocase TatB [Vibrio sp. 10N.286.49.B3]
MFDIGFWEMLLISVLGLIILGPEKLPKAIRFTFDTTSKIKSMASNIQDELNKEIRIKELQGNIEIKEKNNSSK